jgi:hypothetical protein
MIIIKTLVMCMTLLVGVRITHYANCLSMTNSCCMLWGSLCKRVAIHPHACALFKHVSDIYDDCPCKELAFNQGHENQILREATDREAGDH